MLPQKCPGYPPSEHTGVFVIIISLLWRHNLCYDFIIVTSYHKAQNLFFQAAAAVVLALDDQQLMMMTNCLFFVYSIGCIHLIVR